MVVSVPECVHNSFYILYFLHKAGLTLHRRRGKTKIAGADTPKHRHKRRAAATLKMEPLSTIIAFALKNCTTVGKWQRLEKLQYANEIIVGDRMKARAN